jgi:hypothetical protein
LLFGNTNSPWPSPETISGPTIARVELVAPSWASRTRPSDMIARPTGQSQREPNRSASDPATGATTAMVSDNGVSSSPER